MYLGFVVIKYGKIHKNRNKYSEGNSQYVQIYLETEGINCHPGPLQEAPGFVRRQKESKGKHG